LIRYPPLAKAGTTCDRLAVSVDLAPTILEIAGAAPLSPLHGRSLVPLLRDPAAPWRTAILTEYSVEKVAPQVPAWRAVRTERRK
jgi:arylsulfatase A-like enzyme